MTLPPPRRAQVLARVLLGGLLCALPLPGCKRGASPSASVAPAPAVRVLEVSVSGGAIGTPFGDDASQAVPGEAELRAAAAAGLRRAGVLLVEGVGPSRPRGDYRLKLELGLTTVSASADTDGKGLLRAAVRGRLQRERAAGQGAPEPKTDTRAEPPGDDLERLDQEVLAEKIVPGAEVSPARLRAHGQRAVEDTAATLGAQLKLLEADTGRLLQVVQQEGDNDLRGAAIRVLGLRKTRAAVTALAALLRDPEPEIRDKAIGALISIGDRSAVKPMASSAQFSDTHELRKILDAVAYLGGDEAKSYLGFVAAGHQSEEIRSEARVALSHLEQREQRARPGTEPR